jgi:hypothetical protein
MTPKFIPGLSMGDARLESCGSKRLYRERLFVVFFPAGCYLKVGHDRFFPHPFTFITCRPPNAGQCTITTLCNTLSINSNTDVITFVYIHNIFGFKGSQILNMKQADSMKHPPPTWSVLQLTLPADTSQRLSTCPGRSGRYSVSSRLSKLRTVHLQQRALHLGPHLAG